MIPGFPSSSQHHRSGGGRFSALAGAGTSAVSSHLHFGYRSLMTHANAYSESVYRFFARHMLGSTEYSSYGLPAALAGLAAAVGVGIFIAGGGTTTSLYSLLRASVSADDAMLAHRPRTRPNRNDHQRHMYTFTPSGLINLGNTCFVNCVLQALASCPQYVSYLDDRWVVCARVYMCASECVYVYFCVRVSPSMIYTGILYIIL